LDSLSPNEKIFVQTNPSLEDEEESRKYTLEPVLQDQIPFREQSSELKKYNALAPL